jgi:hypothetical protein
MRDGRAVKQMWGKMNPRLGNLSRVLKKKMHGKVNIVKSSLKTSLRQDTPVYEKHLNMALKAPSSD